MKQHGGASKQNLSKVFFLHDQISGKGKYLELYVMMEAPYVGIGTTKPFSRLYLVTQLST